MLKIATNLFHRSPSFAAATAQEIAAEEARAALQDLFRADLALFARSMQAPRRRRAAYAMAA
ncbi:MAG: hypothetical protein RIT14_2774 [Pseudomonadota bacterium]